MANKQSIPVIINDSSSESRAAMLASVAAKGPQLQR
jgi:hypothetical protein